MSFILNVLYTPSKKQEQLSDEQRDASATKIAAQPGLIWKVYVGNDAQRRRGGIYYFDTEANASAWGEDNLRASLTAAGATDIELTYLDVNTRLSRITRAPLQGD